MPSTQAEIPHNKNERVMMSVGRVARCRPFVVFCFGCLYECLIPAKVSWLQLAVETSGNDIHISVSLFDHTSHSGHDMACVCIADKEASVEAERCPCGGASLNAL